MLMHAIARVCVWGGGGGGGGGCVDTVRVCAEVNSGRKKSLATLWTWTHVSIAAGFSVRLSTSWVIPTKWK